eukprot:5247103-Pyramimonas_sp.AAC.1
MQESGKAYAKDCKEKGKDHGNGPPWPHVFLGLLHHFITQDGVDPMAFKVMKTYWKYVTKLPKEEALTHLQEQIRFLR